MEWGEGLDIVKYYTNRIIKCHLTEIKLPIIVSINNLKRILRQSSVAEHLSSMYEAPEFEP